MGGTPYPAVFRLYWYWRLNEADISGRLTLQGIQIEDEPAALALDLIYTLWLDDTVPLGETRGTARKELDEILAKPLHAEPDEWGLTPDAVQAGEQADAMFDQWAQIPGGNTP